MNCHVYVGPNREEVKFFPNFWAAPQDPLFGRAVKNLIINAQAGGLTNLFELVVARHTEATKYTLTNGTVQGMMGRMEKVNKVAESRLHFTNLEGKL